MGFGVVATLRTSGVSVTRSLKTRPPGELSGWGKGCIEPTSAIISRYVRHGTSSQCRGTSAPLPEESQAWHQLTVAIGSGSVGKEYRAANVGGEGIGHDLVALCVLQTSDALVDMVKVQGKPRSVCMATRHVDPADEALRSSLV